MVAIPDQPFGSRNVPPISTTTTFKSNGNNSGQTTSMGQGKGRGLKANEKIKNN